MLQRLFILVLLLGCQWLYGQHFNWAGGLDHYAYPSDVVVDQLGYSYSTGYFNYHAIDFDPGPGTFMLTPAPFTYPFYVLKLDPEGQFVWAKSSRGTNFTDGLSVAVDAEGSVVTAGRFNGETDFDPGVDSLKLSADWNFMDIFIQKLDANGDFLWAKQIGGSNHDDLVTEVTVDGAGNVYLTGYIKDTVDLDPGVGVDLQGIPNGQSAIVVKLDAAGNYQWGKTMNGALRNEGLAIAIDASGNIYLSGVFNGLTDFDPGPGVTTLPFSGVSTFIVKWNAAGNFVWAKSNCFGANLRVGIALDHNGDLILGGYTNPFSGDLDPGPGVYSASVALNGSVLFKLNSGGNFVWGGVIDGPNIDYVEDLDVDANGGIYLTGHFQDSCDFDPGPGVNMVIQPSSVPNNCMYICKLSNAGNLAWVKTFDGAEGYGVAIGADDSGKVYTVGTYDGLLDFNPGPATYNLAATDESYILSLDPDSCAHFAISIDTLASVPCGSLGGYIHVLNDGGIAPLSFLWNTGSVDSAVVLPQGGYYTVEVTDGAGCYQTRTVLINGPAFLIGFDLLANLHVQGFRPGNISVVYLNAMDQGCWPTASQLDVIVHGAVTLVSASLTPDQIIGDTLRWNLPPMSYGSPHFQPALFFLTDSTATLGDSVCIETHITPSVGDQNPGNNDRYYCFPIRNSFDPNDKQVYPQGACQDHRTLLDGQPLTYTLRFQNIGTAEAIDISVRDTLAAGLDIETVRIVGSSHPMHTELLPGRVLNFIFEDIHLVSSQIDEVASQGYVIFQVQLDSSSVAGTEVRNQGAIYFDYNPPVVTNACFNLLVDTLLPCSVLAVEPTETMGLKLFPNPNGGTFYLEFDAIPLRAELEMYDLSGAIVLRKSIAGAQRVTCELELPKGLYFLRIVTEQGLVTRKMVIR